MTSGLSHTRTGDVTGVHAPEPGEPWIRAALHTLTGSVYTVVQDTNGLWWLVGDNRASDSSMPLADGGPWRIEPPQVWPPAIGVPAVIYALLSIPYGDPARVPGGGKITSPVQRVEWVVGSADRAVLP